MASGNDKDLKIGIHADTSGAEEAKRALEGVKDATEKVAKTEKEVADEAAKQAKNLEEYHKFLEDHEKRQAEYAAKRLELEKQVTQEVSQQKAVATSTPALNPAPSGNPMSMPSRLMSPETVRESTAAIKEQTAAIKEQEQALEALSDEEAGVGRHNRKKYRQEQDVDRVTEGVQALRRQQMLIENARLFRELAGSVSDFVKEFAKTDEGRKFFSGLSDGVKEFGSNALNIASSVGAGFAAGGPVGGAIAGLTAVVQRFAEEYLDAQRRIEQSNLDLKQAEAANFEENEKKRKAAASREIERTLKAEKELLEDQNSSLAAGNELWKARSDAARSALDLERANAELKGGDTNAIDRKKIDLDERREMTSLKVERDKVYKELADAIRAKQLAEQAQADIYKTYGEDSPQAESARGTTDTVNRVVDRTRRNLTTNLESIRQREIDVRNQSQADRVRLEDRRLDSELEARRRQQAQERERAQESMRRREQAEREKEREQSRIEGIGRSAEGIAGRAASRAEREGLTRGAAAIDKAGEALRNDPTAAELKTLNDLISQLLASLEAKGSKDTRSIRDLQKQVRELQGKLKTGGDVSHR